MLLADTLVTTKFLHIWINWLVGFWFNGICINFFIILTGHLLLVCFLPFQGIADVLAIDINLYVLDVVKMFRWQFGLNSEHAAPLNLADTLFYQFDLTVVRD